MEHEAKAFLGRGWSFPPSFDRLQARNQMSTGLADIEESIRIILGTTPGERIMQPEFGCNLNKLVFEHIDALVETEIGHIIGRALLNFEPRIIFEGVHFTGEPDQEGFVRIRIDYSLITTNTRHNIVYPFYIAEGTNISS